MKLLVLTQYFWPENFRINELVQELTTRGHEVTVLTGWPNYPEGRIFPAFRDAPSRFARYHGAKIVRVPLAARRHGGAWLVLNYLSFALSASLLGPLKLRGAQFDRILVFEPSPITVGVPAAVLRRLRKAPVALWVLDLWPETLQAIGVVKQKWLLRLVGALVRLIYDRCDLILAQSRSFVPQIGRYCRRQQRVVYFPNWADVTTDPGEVAPAPEVPVQAGAFNVMFAGNIGEAQDFPAVLAAADLLRADESIRWLIVGDGRAADWVRQEIVRRNLQHRVVMLGRFPPERMPSFYRHAGALLVSLRSDPIFAMTIPAKVQSYLAAGIPIAAMLEGEGARLIEEAGAGVTCASGDPQGLARIVRSLAALSAEERTEMGRRGRAIAARDFNRGVQVGKLEHWLAELELKRD